MNDLPNDKVTPMPKKYEAGSLSAESKRALDLAQRETKLNQDQERRFAEDKANYLRNRTEIAGNLEKSGKLKYPTDK